MRSRSAAALALALVVGLSGCVSMPEDGPVVETQSGGDVSSESGIYIDPKPPQAGDTRPDIVRGFLAAMTATPIRTEVARQFLSEDAAASWNPENETITYADATPPQESADGVSVRLTEPDRLDARGGWQGALPRAERTLSFPMTFEDGQWRIDHAPDALIVPESWFEQRFRQVSLYFFDPTATMLAPEPVFVPRGEALATTLVQGLLMGPGNGLERVAQSFVPSGLKVAVGVVISDDGIADIPLKGEVGPLTSKAIELMMAQFAWTLRQEPQVEGLRISINGDSVTLPGGVSSYRIDGGAEYDPAGFQASPLLYGLRDGVLVSGTANALRPVDGPLGTRDRGIRTIGVDLSASRVAGVTLGGTSVLVAPLSSSDRGTLHTVASGNDFLRPAWDFADRLWLVDRAPDGARVSYVQGNRETAVHVPGITGTRVRMFLVSRDGTRLVAVVRRPGGDTLVVSRIKHGRTGRVLGATSAERISAEGEVQLPIRDIAWQTTTSIAVLSPFTSSLAQLRMASVDGSPASRENSSATVEGRLRALAGSPAVDEALYGVTRRELIDVSGSERRITPLEDGVSTVVYVG
jgi:Lipoprotein LpqB beta-propeller domain/Sporulation and spore germination